jgi:hypothetical protein
MHREDPHLAASMQLQMIEIYDDCPYDLLIKGNGAGLERPKLRVREHPVRGPFCEGWHDLCGLVSIHTIIQVVQL